MKRFFLLIAILSMVLSTRAALNKNAVLIRGQIKNAASQILRLETSGFFEPIQLFVEMNQQGHFSRMVTIDGEQEINLILHDEIICIHAKVGDTIEVQADLDNFKNSLLIKSPNQINNKQLGLSLKMHFDFLSADSIFSSSIQRINSHDKANVFQMANDHLNHKLAYILNSEVDDDFKFTLINSAYFEHQLLLHQRKLLPLYALYPDSTILGKQQFMFIKSYIATDKVPDVLSTKLFYKCPEYRDYIFALGISERWFPYTIATKEYNGSYIDGAEQISYPEYTKSAFYQAEHKPTEISEVRRAYYFGLINFSLVPIRDWFITKNILLYYENDSAVESEKIFEEFKDKCETKVYLDTLISYHTKYSKYRKKEPAPNFALRDQYGKLVSLKSFRGKIVYIDFWGTTCPPCLYEISGFSKKLEHRYTGKDVVFLNICVDADLQNFKKAIDSLKIGGINLIAENWTNNPVCKDYSINGIPHYILLDREGNFIDYQALRPSQLLRVPSNIIDSALSDQIKPTSQPTN